MAPATGRVEACCRFARHFLGSLTTEDAVTAAAELWRVDLARYDTDDARLKAIVEAAGTWYWDRALACYGEWVALGDTNTSEEQQKEKKGPTAAQQAYVKAKKARKPLDLEKASPHEARVYLADHGMEKPISAVQNLFTNVKKQLTKEGLTWAHHFTNTTQTTALRSKGQERVNADAALGTLKFDLGPIVEWACTELLNPRATMRTLGHALGAVTGRRRVEVKEHGITKYSKYELKITHLAKKRVSVNRDTDDDDDEDDDWIPSVPLGDNSFIILCLAPADDIMFALDKLRQLSAGINLETYGAQVIKEMDNIEVLTPFRAAWSEFGFNRRFVPHNHRCIYIAYLHWNLGEQGLWPKDEMMALCIQKYLGHSSLNTSTNYYKLKHVPAAPAAAPVEQTAPVEKAVQAAPVEKAVQAAPVEKAASVTQDNSDDEDDEIRIEQKKIELAQMQLALRIKRNNKRKREEREIAFE
jgi:hypothetical protein